MNVASLNPAARFPVLTGIGAVRLGTSSDRIIVVGAGGWLGLATLELLQGLLGHQFAKRVIGFGSVPRLLRLRGGVSIEQRGLEDLATLSDQPSLVLHLAYLTQEKAKAMADADYIAANRAISNRVLDALDGIGARGVFVPSSGAVYAADQSDASASLRLYGALKRADEAAFGAWSQAPGKRAVIVRVFNLSGPYINKQSSYALACFIADALAGRPLEIRAARPVYRSYVAIAELMSVVFALLTDGETGLTLFDTAGDRDYEMGEIAQVVQEVLNHPNGVIRPVLSEAPPDRYTGDGVAYRRARSRFDVEPVDFPSQVLDTARYMAESGHATAA
jgi:nucleoside-diphosphate-sugar epimerase